MQSTDHQADDSTVLNVEKSDITDQDLAKFKDVTELNVSYCEYVTNINHFKKLKKLIARGFCGLTDDGIKDLNELEEVEISYNYKLTKLVSPKLKKIIAIDSRLSEIKHADKVEYMNVSRTRHLWNLSRFKHLKIFIMEQDVNEQLIDLTSLSGLTDLESISIDYKSCKGTVDLSHSKKLKDFYLIDIHDKNPIDVIGEYLLLHNMTNMSELVFMNYQGIVFVIDSTCPFWQKIKNNKFLLTYFKSN